MTWQARKLISKETEGNIEIVKYELKDMKIPNEYFEEICDMAYEWSENESGVFLTLQESYYIVVDTVIDTLNDAKSNYDPKEEKDSIERMEKAILALEPYKGHDIL